MPSPRTIRRHTPWVLALSLVTSPLLAAPPEIIKPSEAALAEAAQAAKQIHVPKGVRTSLWAAEPLLENPVSFSFDEKGRMYVTEAFRIRSAVLDNRGRAGWPSEAFKKKATPEQMAQIGEEILNAELAARTVADRERLVRTYFEGDLERFTRDSDVVKRITDTNGDGVADEATVFATGFNRPMDGLMSGVLARHGQVWVTNIPSLWRLSDKDDDGVADAREEVSTGYGVRFAFMGHDMHGLRIGPDGRLYYSIGDRGATVKNKEGKLLSAPDRGAVFRSELDGSRLEIYAEGLRNPQELAFDEFGNLFTGDNNSDGGDEARFVYVVQGGDSGWRTGYQYLTQPVSRGPWNGEKMWAPPHRGQPAYIVPPIQNITNGPSGLTYHPGTGHLAKFKNHFFLVDFRGQPSSSGVHGFRLAPKGAGYTMVAPQRFAWGVLATDVDFGPDGALYISDWVWGWDGTGKGRVHRLTDERPQAATESPSVQSLIDSDLTREKPETLATWLAHPDARVRAEAQFALAQSGRDDLLTQSTEAGKPLLARLHGLWGLGQILRQAPGAKARPSVKPEDLAGVLLTRLSPKGVPAREDEVRAQAAKVLADAPPATVAQVVPALTAALSDRSARVRFFAAQSLARLKADDGAAMTAVVGMLARNDDKDPFLRHAGVMALAAGQPPEALAKLADHPSRAVRLAATVALRRHESPLIEPFLRDRDPLVVAEAARAINDRPIEEANDALAKLADAARPPRDPVVLSRVVHANFRRGGEEAARALVRLAADRGVPAAVRREAVASLGEWTTAQPRDRVTGAYRPLPPKQMRNLAVAAAAVEGALDKLLARRQPELFVVAANTATRLKLKAAAPLLAQAIAQRWDNEDVRLASLEALSALQAPELGPALEIAAKDGSPKVRLWALRARAKADPSLALGLVDEAMKKGTLEERQAAVQILAQLPAPEAEARLCTLMDQVLAGKLPQGLVLDVLEAAQKKGSADIKTKLAAYEEGRPQTDLGPYQEVTRGGDPELGRRIFMYHGLVQCRRCHSIEGHGSEVGPQLLGIGRRRSPEYLLEAVVYPSKHFAPGFESVLVTMKSGSIHGGTVKRETPKVLLIDSAEEGALTLTKKEIADREPGASGMPDGFGTILTKRELRDLIAFLAASK